MSNRVLRLLAAATSALIFLFFTAILLLYVYPREETSYSFSIADFGDFEGSHAPAFTNYDQKGWTVFVQEGQQHRELTADGFGGFSGLSRLDQTFYFSRVMTERVERPVLTLSAANRAVAVFLDDELLYSDDPGQDNRVGYLNLSTLAWDRDAITVSLPPDYLGKTLTVAQSNSAPETQTVPPLEELRVYPCAVTLAGAYAQEQDLISRSFSTALTAALCFALGVTALSSFLWQGFHQAWDPGLALLSLAGFVLMASIIFSTDFFYFYFPELSMDIPGACRAIFLSLLLAYLGHQGGRGRQALTGRGIRGRGPAGPPFPQLHMDLPLRVDRPAGAGGSSGSGPDLAKGREPLLPSVLPHAPGRTGRRRNGGPDQMSVLPLPTVLSPDAVPGLVQLRLPPAAAGHPVSAARSGGGGGVLPPVGYPSAHRAPASSAAGGACYGEL